MALGAGDAEALGGTRDALAGPATCSFTTRASSSWRSGRRGRASSPCRRSTSTGTARTWGRSGRTRTRSGSLGVHDLSVILFLLDEEPSEVPRAESRSSSPARRGRRLLPPPLPLREGGAHAPLLARPATGAGRRSVHREDGRLQHDMKLDRKVTVYDSAAEPSLLQLRRVEHAHRRCLQPAHPQRRATPARGRALPRPRRARGCTCSPPACAGLGVVVDPLSSSRPRSSESAFQRGGSPRARSSTWCTVLGDDVVIGDNAVVGKPPTPGALFDRTRRGAAPARRRRRHGHPRLRRRLRRQPPRQRRDRRRPGVRERCELEVPASSSAAARSS